MKINSFVARFRAVFCTIILACIAQSTFALSLQQAYDLAQQHDANYASALARYEAEKLNLPLANSARRPNASATAGVIHNYDKSSPDGGSSTSADARRSQLALNVSQSLYNKSIRHDVDAAETGLRLAGLQLGQAREELASVTVERYLAVLSALDNQTLAGLERTAIDKQLDLATQRLDVGLGTKTDQFDAQARFESSNAGLIAADNEVLNAQQALEALMNQAITGKLSDAMATLENDNVELGQKAEAYWIEAALSNNITHLIQQLQVELQQIEVERTGDGRLPTLALVAGASTSDSGETIQSPAGRQRNWNIGLQGSIPVYQGGSIKLQQQKAGHGLNAAKAAEEQSRRDTDRTVRSAFRGVQSLQQQVQALQQAVRASQSALDSKQEGFKAGVTTNLDVLDGQRDLFRARRDYLKSSYDLVNAIVQLERVAGKLDGDDITRINTWLN